MAEGEAHSTWRSPWPAETASARGSGSASAGAARAGNCSALLRQLLSLLLSTQAVAARASRVCCRPQPAASFPGSTAGVWRQSSHARQTNAQTTAQWQRHGRKLHTTEHKADKRLDWPVTPYTALNSTRWNTDNAAAGPPGTGAGWPAGRSCRSARQTARRQDRCAPPGPTAAGRPKTPGADAIARHRRRPPAPCKCHGPCHRS